MLRGCFVAVLELHTDDKRKRRDCDNRIKAAIDYAVRLGCVQDDSFMEVVICGWVDTPPPHGARLTLIPFDQKWKTDYLLLLLRGEDSQKGDQVCTGK